MAKDILKRNQIVGKDQLINLKVSAENSHVTDTKDKVMLYGQFEFMQLNFASSRADRSY